MTTEWEPELLETEPEEFIFLPNGDCVQRKELVTSTVLSIMERP